jgi:predicted ATPase/class 3 adenylate cyclase/DNA-binding CsgD family transcriptional regulator
MPEFPVGTVTLLFIDIEGSTRLLQQLGKRYAEVMETSRSLLRSAFLEFHGHEVDTQGDAFFVAFARATDAVSAAVAAQRALFTHFWPGGVTVLVRMGVHTGEPEPSSEGYVGLDVHHAARIMSAGHGGQVLLSRTTHDLVEYDLPDGVDLRDLGEHRLKDLQRPSHLYQLVIEGLPADFPPLKTLESHPQNLPIQLTPFIGRVQEVATVQHLLQREGVHVLTLTGPGGSGKTRLGLQVAAELSDVFPDGVFFVNLAPISEPAFVLSTIAQTLGIKESGAQPFLDLLKASLHDKHMLLLLDNFEQVISAAVQVAELLAACPKLKAMVTSREALHVRGEQEFAVPPLSLPDHRHLPELAVLSQYEAVALFIQRAQAISPGFQVTNANAPAVAEICVRLDGLPLAIELAAARIKLFPPQALLARLGQRLQLLTGGSRDAPARQQTLRNTIAWSYQLLGIQEQQLFRRVSVFVGGCRLEAIEALCIALETSALTISVVDGIASLLDKSLLQQREQEGEVPRLLMLETIRAYGLEMLEASGEADASRQTYAAYYLRLAEEAEPALVGPQQAGWLQRLEQEHDNLRAALEWALGQGTDEQAQERRELALRLSVALEPFWAMRGPYREACTFLERALAQSEGENDSLRARVLQATAFFVFHQGDFDRAEVLAQQSLALYRELGNTRGIANAISLLTSVAETKGKAAEELALAEEQVRLMRQIGEPGEVAYALFDLADTFSLQGEYARGQALFEEALLLFRKAGNELLVGATLVWSACYLLWSAAGDRATVRQRLQQGQALISKVGDRKWMAHSAAVAALVALSEGETVRAYELAQESLTIYREIDYRRYIAVALYILGQVEAQRSDLRAALSHYVGSLALAQELGDTWPIPLDLEGLASVLATQGQLSWAAQLWGAAEALREGTTNPLPPVDRPSYERAVTTVRAQLGEQAFTTSWQEGRSMKLEQVIAESGRMALSATAPAGQAAIPTAKTLPTYPAGLTPREVEVLCLVAQGLTDAQVAEQLVISPRTVNTHLTSIYNKLGVDSRTAATRFALDHQLV